MIIDALQHINVHATDLERSKDFYASVLGLRVGPRPPFASRGYWLYLGEQPVVHLVERLASEPPASGGGAIDHIAFAGRDLASARDRLRRMGIAFRESVAASDGARQLFLHEPDGITVELNFSPDQA